MRFSWLTLALLAFPLLAAIPPRSPQMLDSDSTQIVTGKVKAVYSSKVNSDKPDWADVHYLVEIVISKVEKGEGPVVGKVLYAKCWQPDKRPRGWAGPQGQNIIPKVGDTGRLFLHEGDDGSFHLLEPNGWAPDKP